MSRKHFQKSRISKKVLHKRRAISENHSQHWPVHQCQRISSAFLFLPSLYVEVTPNGHWLDELHWEEKGSCRSDAQRGSWIKSVAGRPRWRSKPPVTAAGGSFHFAYISSPLNSARIFLKGMALIGFISNTNRTFLQPKLRWNGVRRLEDLTSSSASRMQENLRISPFLKLFCPKSHTTNFWLLVWTDRI